MQQVFKKAKVNEFDGVDKTGEDMEAWIEELEDYFALRKFSAEAKAKVAVVHLRSCAKLWWKAYLKQRTKITPITWEEFKTEAYKRYCSPHYEMDKKMDFYKFQQEPEGEPSLSVHEYKEKFLRLHKYAPEVEGEALKNKFVEGLRKDIYYQVKGAGATDFLDAIAKVESYEKKVRYEARNNTQGRVISTGHRPQGRSFQPTQVNTGSVQRKFPHNQRRPLLNFANQGQNSNQNVANNRNQNFGQNGANPNQRRRQPLRWQHDPEFLERARKLGLCFRCGEQGHKTFECPNK